MRVRAGSAAAVVLALLGAAFAADEPSRPTEYDMKAAYLFHFAKFVRWPEEDAPGSSFVIAVLGEDPFGAILDRMLEGKTILSRKIEVRRVTTLPAGSRIHVLFVGSSEEARLGEILQTLRGSSVLTVGDMEGFVDRGGMIAFKLREDTVRFEVNLSQVERAKLKMSSQLIRLAQRVVSKGGGL
jgi:hypothetical protein